MSLACIINFGLRLFLGSNERLIESAIACSSDLLLNVRINTDCEIDLLLHKNSEYRLVVKPGFGCPYDIRVDEWRISVSSTSSITNVFEPRGFGRLTKQKFNVSFPSMQFTALFLDWLGCIYFGIHDGRAFPKRFFFDGETAAGAEYSGPREMDGNGLISLPFMVEVIEGETCSWTDISSIYMQFAVGTEWYAKGLNRREERPDWMNKIPLWINTHWQENDVLEKNGGKPSVVLERVKQFKNVIGDDIPIFMHWYEWSLLGYKDSDYTDCPQGSVCGFDSHYPNYFPARDNFENTVKALQQINVYTIPYINGRLFDKSLEAWASDPSVKASAVVSENGEFADENYGNDVHFAAICPATDWWMVTMSEVCKRLVDSGVSGVYLDQLAAGDPVPCFNEMHEHAPGGGSSWTPGTNKILDSVRMTIGDDKLIITESNVEQLIGSVDTFLTLVAYDNLDSLVPAFQYIYGGGLFITAGAEFFESDVTEDNGSRFMAKLTKMFMLGSQLGWMSLGGRDNQKPPMGLLDVLMMPENRPLVEAMKELIRQRMDPLVTEFFSRGRLVKEINHNAYIWRNEGNFLAIACNPDSEPNSSAPIEFQLVDLIHSSTPLYIYSFSDGSWILVLDQVRTVDAGLRLKPDPRSCEMMYINSIEQDGDTIHFETA
jgi:hypothetical protein